MSSDTLPSSVLPKCVFVAINALRSSMCNSKSLDFDEHEKHICRIHTFIRCTDPSPSEDALDALCAQGVPTTLMELYRDEFFLDNFEELEY